MSRQREAEPEVPPTNEQLIDDSPDVGASVRSPLLCSVCSMGTPDPPCRRQTRPFPKQAGRTLSWQHTTRVLNAPAEGSFSLFLPMPCARHP